MAFGTLEEENCLFIVILLILIFALVLFVILLVLVLVAVLLILILVVVLIVHSICNFLPTDFMWIPGEGIHTVSLALRIFRKGTQVVFLKTMKIFR